MTETETPQNSVGRYGRIMVISLFLSRVLGMIRDTVMTAQFGIGLPTDAYRLAVVIPDTIFMLIAGGGLSSAFIPVFAEYWHKDRRDQAWRVFSVVVTLTTIIAAVLVLIAYGFAPQIVNYFRDNKPETAMPAAIHMSRIMLPAQIAFLTGSVLLATLYVRKQFLAPALSPNVYNVGIILGAIALPGMTGMGIESMAWGALIGAILGNIVLPIFFMIRTGSSFRPSLNVREEGVGKFYALLLPVILGFSLPSMLNIITQKFASSYAADGVNTVLALSNNLMQAPLGIFGQSLALAAFPVLAEFVATNRMDLYRDQISKTLRTVLFLGVPSGILLAALAPQVVHVLYGYGKATEDPEQLAAVVRSLRLYSVAIFAWCMQPVLMRGFFSLQKTLKPVALSTILTVLFIVLGSLATKNSPDYGMLIWATNICALLLAFVLFVTLEGDVGKLDRRGIALTLVKSAAASTLSGGFAWGCMQVIRPSSRFSEAASLFFVGLVALWVYYFAAKLFKMPESVYFSRALRRKPNHL